MPLPGRNEAVVADAPFLQWANGLVKARRNAGAGPFTSHVGWMTEVGRAEDLDEACAQTKLQQIEVKHSGRDGRDGTIKRYWSFGDEIGLYVITTGPVAPTVGRSVKADNAWRSAEAGLGVRWPETERDGTRGKSRLAIRTLAKPLTDVGYLSPLQVTATGLMSEKLLSGLLAHNTACEQAEQILGRVEPVFPGELLLPLGPGEETAFGKAQSTLAFPMICRHPKQLDAEYVQAQWRSEAVHAALERLWPAVQSWARGYTQEQQTAESAVTAALPDDLYLPDDVTELVQCIRAAERDEVLEAYRGHILALRDRRTIDAAEAMRLLQLVDDRADELMVVF